MKPWIDRNILIENAKAFVKSHGYFLREHAKRISGLVEVAVYNSIVSYYQIQRYELSVEGLGPKKSFRYKVSAAGLLENFSHFRAIHPETGFAVIILQNTKIQSAHNAHLYYTPDVCVSVADGAKTVEPRMGRKHSFVQNDALLTFVEVKHLIPFPEALYGFTGLVQEFAPRFISGKVNPVTNGDHLCPLIAFTGVGSRHTEDVRNVLSERYGINIVYGTQKCSGSIALVTELKRYSFNRG